MPPISATVSGGSISATVSSGTPVISASTGLPSGGTVSVRAPSQSVSLSGITVSSGVGISVGGTFGGPSWTLFPTSPSGATVVVENLLPYKPSEYAWMVSVLDSGSMSLSVRTSTGYAAVMWWDGSVSIHGSGTPDLYMTAQKSVPTSGNWSRSAPKHVFVWPCLIGSATYSGSMTGLSCSSKKLTAISVADCESLTSLACDSNLIEYVDVRNCTSLQELYCYGNRLGSMDLSTLTSLVSLYCQNNYLSSLSLTNNTRLETLQCDHNELATLTLSANTLLQNLYCHNNALYSLVISANTRLKNMNVSSNRIMSISVGAGTAFSGIMGCNLSYNLLDAGDLDGFYTAVSPVSSGTIFVTGNPGASGDTPSIATAKGYAVYGT